MVLLKNFKYKNGNIEADIHLESSFIAGKEIVSPEVTLL